MATDSNSTGMSCENPNTVNFRDLIRTQEELIRSMTIAAEGRFTRIIEMAKLIHRESDDLPVDCEPCRFRVCAEVISEAIEIARDEVEKIEMACAVIRHAHSREYA